jgi:hypothetical protein
MLGVVVELRVSDNFILGFGSFTLHACVPGAPAELMEEDSKFVPLNADDPMYGPPVSHSSGLFTCSSTSLVAAFL